MDSEHWPGLTLASAGEDSDSLHTKTVQTIILIKLQQPETAAASFLVAVNGRVTARHREGVACLQLHARCLPAASLKQKKLQTWPPQEGNTW